MRLDVHAALGHPHDQAGDLEVDDLAQLLAAERVELDDVVEAVDELRLEVGLHAGAAARDVGGHDQHRVLEVHGAALAVGEAAVVDHLQQDVEDVVVGLLDLVEQDDGVRAPAHGLGELAALLVADVAGRRADEPRDGVLLHVLGHVDADHRVLAVEHELGQRARQLGLADAGRAEEQERADRAVGVAEARRGSGAARRETASTASSWPITRWWRRSSMWISFSTSPSTSRETGMPVHLPTTSAISSTSTRSER